MAPRARRRGKDSGRFTCDEQSSSSLACMTAYAAHLAIRERRTTYVRVVGASAAIRRCEFGDDGAVTVVVVTP